MFLNYYRLHEPPFGVTPDPKYTYFTSTHREALASLAYAVEMGSGFAVLVAKPGMGKTTLLFRLLDYLQDKARTVFVFHTQCNSVDLLRYILADMKIKYNGKDLVEMHGLLNEALLSEARVGRTVVVAIDESHNLSHEVLETIRLLSDFETPRRKLLQIILCGQPQLGHKLAHPDLVQLRQRITVLCRLAPLSLQEVAGYIDHRLRIAGQSGGSLFTPEAVQLISTESRGIPRVINTLCSSALSIGCALKRSQIGPDVVQEVLSDLSVDSLIAEMATSETELNAKAKGDGAQQGTSLPPFLRKGPLSQALADMLAMPAVKPTTEAQDEDALPGASELASKSATPFSQALAATIAEPPLLEVSPAQPEAALPAATNITMSGGIPKTKAPTITGIVEAANQFRPFVQRAMKSRILKSKGGWLVGAIILAASLLGITLRFGAPGMKASGRPPIIPDSNTTGYLSGGGTAPALTSFSAEKKNVPPINGKPANKHISGADPVVHVVQTNETLSGISIDYLGRYDSTILQEVQKNNADLKDPDLIRVGQKVFLPARYAVSTDKNSPEKTNGGSFEGKP